MLDRRYPTIRVALKCLALTFARPGEVRGATRDEFNFEKSVWRISAERTNTRKPHDVRPRAPGLPKPASGVRFPSKHEAIWECRTIRNRDHKNAPRLR
jgi:hypothetical protein